MSFKQNVGFVLIILFILSIIISLIGVPAMLLGYFPQEKAYNYEVKAQQVFDTDRIEDEDVTQIEELEGDERRLLYDAFKKSDHFMGTSEVTLYYQEEQLDHFDEWPTVESNGVMFVIAVEEHVSMEPDNSEYKWEHHLVFIALIYLLVGYFYLLIGAPGAG